MNDTIKMDLRIDGRFATDEEYARLVSTFREKKIDTTRPIRHWTIEYIRQLHEDRK